MKKLFLIIACAFSFTTLFAQNKEKYYVYGIDFSYAKVYAAEESVESFAKAFEAINMLIITEPNKYDFSRMVGSQVNVVIEPVLKIVSACDYSQLKTLDALYTDPMYSSIVKNYSLPQTEGVGVVMIAKVLNKPMREATYELITFDIASREILEKREVKGKAGGFGLRNYWAGSVCEVIKSTKLYSSKKKCINFFDITYSTLGLNAISINWGQGRALMTAYPIFLQYGFGLQYARTKKTYFVSYGDGLRKYSYLITSLTAKIPINLLYNFNIPNSSVSLMPYIGLNLQGDIITNIDYYNTYGRHFVIGWQIGTKIAFNKYFVGLAYESPTTIIRDNIKTNQINISLGIKF